MSFCSRLQLNPPSPVQNIFSKKVLRATDTQQIQTIYFHKQPKTIKTQNNNSRFMKDNNNPKHKLKTQKKHKDPI